MPLFGLLGCIALTKSKCSQTLSSKSLILYYYKNSTHVIYFHVFHKFIKFTAFVVEKILNMREPPQRCIQNLVKHVSWKSLTIFARRSIFDVLKGSEYTSAILFSMVWVGIKWKPNVAKLLKFGHVQLDKKYIVDHCSFNGPKDIKHQKIAQQKLKSYIAYWPNFGQILLERRLEVKTWNRNCRFFGYQDITHKDFSSHDLKTIQDIESRLK